MANISGRILFTLLRGFFRLLYQEFAWTYDGVAWGVSMGAWKTWVRSALPYLPGPRVLELGSGPGHLQASLAQAGIEAVGLDASSQMARQAARRLQRLGLSARFLRGRAQALPFNSAIFEQVAATFPTDYIYDHDTLSEILRVLKPGGRLVVIPAGWVKGDAPARRLLRSVYRVTHQSPPAPSKEIIDRIQLPFRQAGFLVEAKILELDSADLLMIIATKA